MHQSRSTGPIAYTDGACLGNPGPGGWGVRILYPDGKVCELGGAAAATTNNRMELQAAIVALQRLGSSSPATIYTDSRYVIEGLTRWLQGWRRRGWKTTANTPVKNRELWQLLERLNRPGIVWQYVRGHSGEPNNERVDAIARAFASGQPPQLFCGLAGSPEDPVHAGPASGLAPGNADQRVRYVSIVQGKVAIDDSWPACAARVRGVAGAHFKKVRTRAELVAFCRAHGVEPPPTW